MTRGYPRALALARSTPEQRQVLHTCGLRYRIWVNQRGKTICVLRASRLPILQGAARVSHKGWKRATILRACSPSGHGRDTPTPAVGNPRSGGPCIGTPTSALEPRCLLHQDAHDLAHIKVAPPKGSTPGGIASRNLGAPYGLRGDERNNMMELQA